MKFSIILNSRNRVPLLNKLLTSIYLNTSVKGLSEVEVLISLDADDMDSQRFLDIMGDYGVKIYYEVIERDGHLNNRLTNLAKQAAGEWIFILNDDTEILTKEWDQIAYESMNTVKDGILYGHTTDNSCDKEYHAQYASFPIVSKKSVDILGYFMHPDFPSLGGDVHLFRLYHELNRVVEVPIQIRHSLHETVEQVMNPDETARVMRSRAGRMDWWGCDITKDVDKLRECLN